MTMGERIARCRQERGLTRKELAKLVYVTTQSVYYCESGRSMPRIDTLARMADIFGVTIDYLVRG